MHNISLFIKFIGNFPGFLVHRYPVPRNVGHLRNIGSISGISMIIQIITGLFLSMFYVPHVEHAFGSIDKIMHIVPFGWMIRYAHLNGASFVFLFLYIHLFRGMYYQSYTYPKNSTRLTGITIYISLMGTAFLGYVLPWGQMSYWAATVITNVLTAVPIVGRDLVYFIWGGFAINNATLNRFSSLHYLLPFIVCIFIFLHLSVLHKTGSGNEIKVKISTVNNMTFNPYLIIKDVFSICIFFILFIFMFFFSPEVLNHSSNYMHSNPIVTPNHIAPEWYFPPFHAILRSIYQKETGILYMVGAILIFYIVPKIDVKMVRVSSFNATYSKFFWHFIFNFIFLGYLGSQPIVMPIIELTIFCIWYHFYYSSCILPLFSKIDLYKTKLHREVKIVHTNIVTSL